MEVQARALVSIIISCCNQARFLPDTIKSAASRDFPADVIVIDDGSTDGAAAVLDGPQFPDVRYVRQSNRGLAAARNRGLAEALGDFLIFLDAGDRLLPGAIDAAARALSARPECVMAYGRCVLTGEDGTIWPTPEPPAVLSGHHAALLRTNLIWMPAMAILRRDAVVRAGGYGLGFDAAADYDLYLRLTSQRPVCDHGRLVAVCRRHSDATSSEASRLLRDTLAVMRRNQPTDPKLRIAWDEGYRSWQEFYGTHLVEEIRAHLRARAPWPALRKATTLARLAPHVCRREIARKSRLTLQPRLRST